MTSPPARHPLVRPPALAPGAKVAIVSPSGPVLDVHINPGIEILRSWGLDPVIMPSVLARSSDRGYLAGDDHLRLKDLHDALADDDVRAIIFSRGGYGAMRLLAQLDPTLLARSPKILVGFSDITAIHMWAAATTGISTLHGPVLKSFKPAPQPPARMTSIEELRRALFGERGGFILDDLTCVSAGMVTGPVFGGNLSLVAAMAATPYCPDLGGAILLLEDIAEPDYRLDRLLMTLALARKSAPIAGIILGEFTDCGGVYVPDDAIDSFVGQVATELDCPVVAGFPSGHGDHNIAVPFGVLATIDANKGRVIFHEDCVC